MQIHDVRTHRSAEDFPRHEHLAAKIAKVAVDPVAVPAGTQEMVLNRIIEDLKSMAAVDQPPKLNGRAVAMILSPLPSHQRKRKFQLFHGELLEEDDDHDDEEEDFDDDIPDDDEESETEGSEEEERA